MTKLYISIYTHNLQTHLLNPRTVFKITDINRFLESVWTPLLTWTSNPWIRNMTCLGALGSKRTPENGSRVNDTFKEFFSDSNKKHHVIPNFLFSFTSRILISFQGQDHLFLNCDKSMKAFYFFIFHSYLDRWSNKMWSRLPPPREHMQNLS